jgi:hypothetical protein
MAVVPTPLGEVIVSGDDYLALASLTKDGGIFDLSASGLVVTCSLRPIGSKHNSLIDHGVFLVSPTAGLVSLILTETETASLLWADAHPDYRDTFDFVADFRVQEPGVAVTHCGPFTVLVRRGVTG